jgi:hypothetical protein
MGNWNINIQGVGCHHNGNGVIDADLLSEEFVKRLKTAGQVVEHATFTHGGKVELQENAAKTARQTELEDLLASARAICQRKGDGTAWERFDERIAKAGIGSVTAKTFRILQSDLEAASDTSGA